jgi:type I restriction enzyme S subunit
MKAGWKTKPLGDICQVIGGGTPTKAKTEYYGGSIPWATVRDLRSEVISETEYKITSEAVKSSSTKIIPKGNVVIATRVGLGKVCRLTQDTAINQDLRGIIPNNKKILLVSFLFLWLKSIAHLIVSEGTGATVQGVKLSFIKSLQVPLPPLSEQQRIISILEKAFADIATAKANAEKNLKNARALFESHLNEVFTRKGEVWEHKRLKEISRSFGRGKSKHRPRNDPKLYGGAYPFIQTGDIRNSDHLITSYSQTYNEDGLSQSKIWPKGTVCITIAANIAETGILNFDACFPDSVIGVATDPKEAIPDFLEYLLQSFKVSLQTMGKGSAQSNINMGTFENEKFPFPPIQQQSELVTELDALRRAVRRLESIYQKKLEALEALKMSLLHEAFRGAL